MRVIGFGESLPLDAVVGCHGAAVTTVVAAPGYPDAPRTGDAIDLPPSTSDVLFFHAGTARSASGSLISAGGRVVTVTALASTVAEAAAKSRAGAERVEFRGRQFRRDIGWRELARHAGTP